MKTITKFVANDNSEHMTEVACIERDYLIAQVNEIMGTLPARPDDKGCDFSNGDGYWQHEPATVLAVRDALLTLARRNFAHKWLDQSLADPTVDWSWAARIIGEGPRPIADAWNRIGCIDKQFREWGQPYYAMNPDRAGSGRCLNAA